MILSTLERPNVHYEAVLGYIEAQYPRQHNLRQGYHGLYSWLVELVYRILYLRHVNNTAFLTQHLPRYDGIRALTETSVPLWIFLSTMT